MNWLNLIALTTVLASLAPCQGVIYKDRLKCPARQLKGGRVRIRSRGRVAKYVCLRGYQVLGDKYSTCIRGKWDTPVPVCISGGCLPVDVPNGQVVETYRGALVTVHCDPGYLLVGTQSLYCNGAVWNDTIPLCREVQVTAQKWCDFESEDLCGWTHDLNHDFDWRRHNFATPSGHVGTGPSFDHTLGPGLNGHYMYLEASSPRLENDTARLFSPIFTKPTDPDSCFVFWYHMFGHATGSLNIYLHNQDTVLLFSQSGDQGNQWQEAVLPLPLLNSSFQIVIEGVRGTGYEGDTAIDDVKLVEGEECIAPTITSLEESRYGIFKNNDSSCENRCSNASIDPNICECLPDCINNNTCCPDYLQHCSEVTTELSTTNEAQESIWNYISSMQTAVMPSTALDNTSHLASTTTVLLLGTSASRTQFSSLNATSSTKSQVTKQTSEKNTNKIITTLTTGTFKPSVKVPRTTLRTTTYTFNEFSKDKSLINVATTVKKTHETTQSSIRLMTPPSAKSYTAKVVKYPQTTSFSNQTTTSLSEKLKTSRLKSTVQSIVTKKNLGSTLKSITKKTTVSYPKTSVFLQPTNKPWFPQVSTLSVKLKIKFKTTPPPVVRWTSGKTTPFLQFTKSLLNDSVDVHVNLISTLKPKLLKNSTKFYTKSKNDVLHPSWRKGSQSNSTTLTIDPRPGYTTLPTENSTLLIKITSSTFQNQSSALVMLPTASVSKWKSKYKPRDQLPVQAQYAVFSPSNQMVHIITLVGVVLLILSTVQVTVCVVRRRKINRRSIEDDELDIQFLASDEILDFTIARPTPDDYQVCETMR